MEDSIFTSATEFGASGLTGLDLNIKSSVVEVSIGKKAASMLCRLLGTSLRGIGFIGFESPPDVVACSPPNAEPVVPSLIDSSIAFPYCLGGFIDDSSTLLAVLLGAVASVFMGDSSC